MFSCPLHNWSSEVAPCPACHITLTDSTTDLDIVVKPEHKKFGTFFGKFVPEGKEPESTPCPECQEKDERIKKMKVALSTLWDELKKQNL